MSLEGLDIPRARGIFVTGTDTEVGKSLISGNIARLLVEQGIKTGVFKPIASGCRSEREGLISSDAEFLSLCAQSEEPLNVINPVSFKIPATPAVCEQREHKLIDYELIASTYRYLVEQNDFMIVEGIGGVRVPLSAGVDLLDLAIVFDLPVVIVTRPNLGTINHTLLTIDAIRGAGLPILGLVISGYDQLNATIAEETVMEVFEEWGRVPVLSVVPYDETADVDNGMPGEQVADSLAVFDWASVQ